MKDKVLCFGEMLWDCFPNKSLPGGAPMNVALHLKQLEIDAKLISRVGSDKEGKLLLEFLENRHFPTHLIQVDALQPTGKVLVDKTDVENVAYEIVSPVAWDFISLHPHIIDEIQQAKALVFGSLSIRNEESWKTLKQLLEYPLIKVFDINLRSPYIDYTKIEHLLNYTTILKINEDELQLLATHFQFNKSDELMDRFCAFVANKFDIQLICITLGSKGAIVYQEAKFYTHQGYKVKVKDTVGAGDAFLSGLIKMCLAKKQPNEVLDFACKLGAFVATKEGGTPKYTIADVDHFLDS